LLFVRVSPFGAGTDHPLARSDKLQRGPIAAMGDCADDSLKTSHEKRDVTRDASVRWPDNGLQSPCPSMTWWL